MIIINEGPPEHPNTVIVQNKFYPSGLTQQEVYDYYMNNKKKLLPEIIGREVIFFINPDINKSIVRRNSPGGKPIKLDGKNYESIIHGRVISIHSTMNSREDFGIIDIDYHNFAASRIAALDVYDYVKKISSASVRYTGKDSFHVVCNFKQKMNIDEIRSYLLGILTSEFKGRYEINGPRNPKRPNLDLSSNKQRGGFITLGSLSVQGLKCMEIDPSSILTFKKEDAKI